MAAVNVKDEKAAVGLKRGIGLLSAINIIIGVMIGSGIFVSPTAALRYSGSIWCCLIVWAICGVISLLGALCFAELGTVVPRSGGEYAYLFETFAKQNKFWGPLPAFICSWVYVMVLRPAEVAVIIMTFSEYAIQPFSKQIGLDLLEESNKNWVIKLMSLLTLCIITYINLRSIKLYVRINNVCSFGKVFACLIVIVGGIYKLAGGHTENLANGFSGTTTHVGHIALAFYNGLWAYDGWSSVTIVTEEIKKPEKNIPKSIAIAVPIVTALYVFINLAYMIVLSPSEMMTSPAVAVEFGERVLGPAAFLIPLGVALSTFGCALSIQFGVTRLCFVAGREGHFLEPMSYIHYIKATPGPAVALQGVIAFVFIVVGDIEALIEFASFLIWVFYGSAVVCLLVLRKTQPNLPRPYKVPLIIPIVTLAVAVFLSVTPIITEPPGKYLAALGFIASGIAVYIPFVYYKYRPRIMDKFSFLLQVLFETVPPAEDKQL